MPLYIQKPETLIQAAQRRAAHEDLLGSVEHMLDQAEKGNWVELLAAVDEPASLALEACLRELIPQAKLARLQS